MIMYNKTIAELQDAFDPVFEHWIEDEPRETYNKLFVKWLYDLLEDQDNCVRDGRNYGN